MTSQQWVDHFRTNATRQRVDWSLEPTITQKELSVILPSLQAWQLGETSEGKNLLKAAARYAVRQNDTGYLEAVELFIREEQKHGNNLGRYLDLTGSSRIRYDWGDTMFRRVRYFNTSMEIWTLAVIVVESAAQLFYQSLKDASGCVLLKQICTDILIDEAAHIDFQRDRIETIFQNKSINLKSMLKRIYRLFFILTTLLIWVNHRKVFKAGGNNFQSYWHKMSYKYSRTLGRVTGYSTRHTSTAFQVQHG